MKPYDVGLICGRFQTFHKGHEKLIDTGLMLCDRLLILIGSSQECGTERNPLNITTREKMLKTVYGNSNNIMIYGLADLTNENDIRPEWGRYLLNNVDRYIYKNPEVMIYGNDESRSQWFDKSDLKNTTELIILAICRAFQRPNFHSGSNTSINQEERFPKQPTGTPNLTRWSRKLHHGI